MRRKIKKTAERGKGYRGDWSEGGNYFILDGVSWGIERVPTKDKNIFEMRSVPYKDLKCVKSAEE